MQDWELSTDDTGYAHLKSHNELFSSGVDKINCNQC